MPGAGRHSQPRNASRMVFHAACAALSISDWRLAQAGTGMGQHGQPGPLPGKQSGPGFVGLAVTLPFCSPHGLVYGVGQQEHQIVGH